MFLKICSGPGTTYIKDGITEVKFENMYSSNVVYNSETKQLFFISQLNDSLVDCSNMERLVDDSKLEDMPPYGNTADMYHLNYVSFYYTEGKAVLNKTFAFTGSAYLCDDSGKTLDVLR